MDNFCNCFIWINNVSNLIRLKDIDNKYFIIYKRTVKTASSHSTIKRIAIFSTFVKLAVDRYNLKLSFGIFNSRMLGFILRFRSVISQLFGQFFKS